MTSLEERLEAAMCEDSTIAIPAQHELVEALLRRDHTGADGETALRIVVPAEELCPNCHAEYDDAGFCGLCGRTRKGGQR